MRVLALPQYVDQDFRQIRYDLAQIKISVQSIGKELIAGLGADKSEMGNELIAGLGED